MNASAPQPDFNQALQARLDQLFDQQAHLAARQDLHHREVMDALNKLREGQGQLPVRLHNAVASPDAPILYPLGVTDDGLPRTKQALLQIGVNRAIIVSRALGLPALPPDSILVNRRQQIFDYLGCGMIATQGLLIIIPM